MTPTSIKQMIQQMQKPTMEFVFGQVISSEPLKIQVIGNEKLILSENIAYVPKHLTDYQAKVDISAPGLSPITNATMTVYNALKPGEIVYILSFNSGKRYYIIDREE